MVEERYRVALDVQIILFLKLDNGHGPVALLIFVYEI